MTAFELPPHEAAQQQEDQRVLSVPDRQQQREIWKQHQPRPRLPYRNNLRKQRVRRDKDSCQQQQVDRNEAEVCRLVPEQRERRKQQRLIAGMEERQRDLSRRHERTLHLLLLAQVVELRGLRPHQISRRIKRPEIERRARRP